MSIEDTTGGLDEVHESRTVDRDTGRGNGTDPRIFFRSRPPDTMSMDPKVEIAVERDEDEAKKYRSIRSTPINQSRRGFAVNGSARRRLEKMARGTLMTTTTAVTMGTRGGVATTSRTQRCAVVTRAAGAAAAKKKNGSTDGPYKARNEFTIPSADAGVRARFESEMRDRETLARELGAVDAKLVVLSNKEFAFEQTWTSKEAYEAYMNHPKRRRSHLAVGVYQRLPADKWSVPDNFTPVTRD